MAYAEQLTPTHCRHSWTLVHPSHPHPRFCCSTQAHPHLAFAAGPKPIRTLALAAAPCLISAGKPQSSDCVACVAYLAPQIALQVCLGGCT
eukprot:1161992-Pelagomonas_calceolata.AAC.12